MTMKLKRLKTLAGGLLAMLATPLASTGALAKDGQGGPAMWKVSDEDTTIYLFGTIHVLPKDAQWRSAQFDKALADADTLVIETLLGDPAESGKLLGSMGVSPNLPPLAERVPPEKRAVLEKMMAATGLPPAAFDRMESWAAALALISVSFAQLGLSSDLGVEKLLTDGYAKAQKPVIGLETVEQQLGFLDTLSEEAQRALLVSAVDDPEAAKTELQKMLAAWLAGDVDGIARSFDSETMLSPELRQSLMIERNRAWSEWIAKRLDQPGKVFVAVGAGHLAGADSVQQMLKGKGIESVRLN